MNGRPSPAMRALRVSTERSHAASGRFASVPFSSRHQPSELSLDSNVSFDGIIAVANDAKRTADDDDDKLAYRHNGDHNPARRAVTIAHLPLSFEPRSSIASSLRSDLDLMSHASSPDFSNGRPRIQHTPSALPVRATFRRTASLMRVTSLRGHTIHRIPSALKFIPSKYSVRSVLSFLPGELRDVLIVSAVMSGMILLSVYIGYPTCGRKPEDIDFITNQSASSCSQLEHLGAVFQASLFAAV